MYLKKCDYDYAENCGIIEIRTKVTVYPGDPEMRETSVREMCKPCFEVLKSRKETIVYSVKYLSSPSRNPDDPDDNDEEDFSGLMNWPPSRGPIDPHLPQRTYLPNLKRDLTFKPVREQPNIKGATGEWLAPYRVSMIRSL